MSHLHQQVADLQQELANRDELIHQLRVEAQGAAEAVNAARAAQAEHAAQAEQAEQAAQAANEAAAAQAAAANNVIRGQQIESVLKSLQTPQILRDLPSFDGNPVKLHSFIRSIENLIPIIDSVRGTNMHTIWTQAIRSKIVGDADNVLELYGTNLEWREIKSNLITHYSDRRDEISLTRDLFGISQIGSVEDFYGKISHIVSLLVNLLNINELNVQVKTAKNLFCQQMGLKVFLSGLKDPLGPIIRAQAPRNMKEALRLCLEEKNYHFGKYTPKPQPPPIPSKPNSQYPPNHNAKSFPSYPIQYRKPFPQFPPRQNHNPFQQYTPRPQQQNFQYKPNPFNIQKPQNTLQFPQNQFVNKNAFAPRHIPQPRPIPMEVDPSIRSRRVNYINRPNYQIPEENAENKNYPLEFNDHEYDQQQYYYEHTEEENMPGSQQNQTDDTAEMTNEPIAEQQDDNETDDLNFQTVEYSRPPT